MNYLLKKRIIFFCISFPSPWFVSQEATLNGQDRSGTFQITDVWVKNKNRWQVVHRHTNLKPKLH